MENLEKTYALTKKGMARIRRIDAKLEKWVDGVDSSEAIQQMVLDDMRYNTLSPVGYINDLSSRRSNIPNIITAFKSLVAGGYIIDIEEDTI